jgi:hypothetical protein
VDKVQRMLVVGGLAAALVVASVGVAYAGISSGGYDYTRHRCTGGAEDSDQPTLVEQGCRSATISVEDGHGTEGLGLGTQQTADGTTVNSFTPPVVQAIDPASGLSAYFGADDNLDNGEHDSSSEIKNGPSDGGNVVLAADPASGALWATALMTGDLGYVLTHPIPFVHAGFGSCADGICESVQTQQALAYQGGDASHQRDAANYAGQEWDPETCAGPSDGVADCGHTGILYWHDKSPTTYVEPGVQIYEDPDPEGSPIGPYPLPALGVTTCGIYLGGGQLTFPASPLTNSAGQLAIPLGC